MTDDYGAMVCLIVGRVKPADTQRPCSLGRSHRAYSSLPNGGGFP